MHFEIPGPKLCPLFDGNPWVSSISARPPIWVDFHANGQVDPASAGGESTTGAVLLLLSSWAGGGVFVGVYLVEVVSLSGLWMRLKYKHPAANFHQP